MSRSICTVFVALAIFQGAFAINVKPHSVINVDMSKGASPSVDSFVGDSSNLRFVGDLTYGQRIPNDTRNTIHQDYSNNQNFVVEAEVRLTIRPDTSIIHYVSAVNMGGSTAVVCYTSKTLGSNEALLKLRLPAKSSSMLFYTVASH